MNFEVGDRVLYAGGAYKKRLNGSFGTIVGFTVSNTPERFPVAHVDWDRKIEGGWDCYGLARYGHGWNVAVSDLYLVPIGTLNLEEVL